MRATKLNCQGTLMLPACAIINNTIIRAIIANAVAFIRLMS